MTLTTVLVAWVLVAALFLGAARWWYGPLNRRGAGVTLAESLVLTLLGGLWFGTWGHQGWPMLFLLLGILVAGSQRGLRSAFLRSPEPFDWRGLVLDLTRYLAAGAVLAWRLG